MLSASTSDTLTRFADKRVVATGGAGFLGSFVVEQVRERGVASIVVPHSRDYDLQTMEAVLDVGAR
jgi:GDP-L-fucose synthase